MRTVPFPLRLEKELQDTLRDGARRTPHRKQELVRITLRRHLRTVIEQEAAQVGRVRLTNLDPWPRRVLEKAYREAGSEWEALEAAALRAQGKPGFQD